MTRSPQLAVRRFGQTLRSFRNGHQVLWDLATSRLPGGSDTLVFQTRTGATIRCPNVPGARVPVYELFAEDAYRFGELLDGLPEDLVALDVGAQVGCFSVALARTAPRARIHAYEASPTTAAWLHRNVATNGLTGRVTPHRAALAAHTGTMPFADNGAGSGMNGLTSPERPGVVEVPCVTFGDAVRAVGSRVDLVKIDVEGAEYDLVLASRAEDWSGVRRVVMEYHAVPGRDWAELGSFFADLGFTTHRHETVEAGFGAVWLSRP